MDDVPINCLDSFINSYKTGNPVCVEFDAEGWTFIIIITNKDSYVIVNKDATQEVYYYDNLKFKTMVKELICDIETYKRGWVCWYSNFMDEGEESEYEIREKLLENKLKELKQLTGIRE